MRFGTVALVGRSNVGKSTFLNAALGERLAIVSPLPQTTRDALLGVVHRQDAQIAFVDTPGIHAPKSELGKRMNAAAIEAARTADIVLMMVNAQPPRGRASDDPKATHAQDHALLELLKEIGAPPRVLVLNKVDRIKNKSVLLPLIGAFTQAHSFESVIPTSVLGRDGVDRVLSEVTQLLPEGSVEFDEDTLTDRPVRYFVREYVREQVMLRATREVPHAVAVSIDSVDEGPDALRAQATIHVQKAGQRGILVGRGGSAIREIGIGARERLQELLQKNVHLELFVRVTPHWKDVPRQLAELGYGYGSNETNALVTRLGDQGQDDE